ncbi:MAG: c-type cytochrome [Candidatus Anammoxibacter sp.]
MKKMKKILILCALLANIAFCDLISVQAGYPEPETLPFTMWDPHNRPKNGPTLNNVTNKVNIDWIKSWIANPKGHDAKARMPNLRLTEDEVEAVIAYLSSIADDNFPKIDFEDFLLLPESEFDDEQYDAMDSLFLTGKAAFSASRCVLCHRVNGEFGAVGVGPDLGKIFIKVNRNWLYQWIKEPQGYFANTQMSKFRLDDEQLRGLVEFLMRDEQFKPELEKYYGKTLDELDEEGIYELPGENELLKKSQEAFAALRADQTLIDKGKQIITFRRCFVCHDIKGFDDLLPPQKKIPEYTGKFAKFQKLMNELRCLTCHRMKGIGGHFAPDLSRAGSKLNEEWELDFLQRPNPVRPLLKQMPKFNLSAEEAALAVEFIETVLVSDDIPTLNIDIPDEAEVAKGKEIFYSKGCNTCHTIGSTGGVVGPNLNQAGTRLEPGYILFHIKDPQMANPGAVEPNFGLTDEEAMSITHFLLTLQD